MTERRNISKTERARIFGSAGGRCYLCGENIKLTETWHLEHAIPLWKGGEDTEANLWPAHVLCHLPKTRRESAERAKEKRQIKRRKPTKPLEHWQVEKPKKQSRPIPGSKRSGFKMRLTSKGPKAEKRKTPAP